MPDALSNIVEAHGGLRYWRSLKSIEVEMSASGFLFKAKRVQPLNRVRLTISTERPEVTTHEYPAPGQIAKFYGEGLIEIQDEGGNALQARKNPREMFRSFRRFFYWDFLDFAYFSSYAMWNYMTMPFLFLSQGVEVKWSNNNELISSKKLTVRFPKGFPTHCETQDFYFDKEWHLVRHDYIAEVVGSWAKAAHLCASYKQFSGLSLPTRRRVYPKLLFNKPLPILTLVAIDIHNVIPCNA
jgi:hypothetical protein